MSAANGNRLKRPVRAGDCSLLWPVYVTGNDGVRSKRVTWCCRERHGFMLSHWKCVGKDHPDCPNKLLSDSAPEQP